MAEEPLRRSTHVDVEASYAAIGASRADDLLKYPPVGSTPFHHESLLGSGEDRFVLSSALLMTWGAQTGAAISVEVLEAERAEHYRGADISASGQPTFAQEGEQHFAPDGTPYLQVGSAARFAFADGFTREMRVVGVVDEPNIVGFIMGTTHPQEVSGEEFFYVEMRSDQSVWAVARGFYHPSERGLFKAGAKKRLKQLVQSAAQQIYSLTPAGLAQAKKINEEVS